MRVGTVIAAFVALAGLAAADRKKPNFVVLFVDDMGWGVSIRTRRARQRLIVAIAVRATVSLHIASNYRTSTTPPSPPQLSTS